MRTFFVSLILILSAFNAVTSQSLSFSLPESSTTASESYQLEVQDLSFTVNVSSRGNHYINRVSERTGNAYKWYCGQPTDHTFQGQTVYRDDKRDGTKSYHIFALNRNGDFIKKVKLNVSGGSEQ